VEKLKVPVVGVVAGVARRVARAKIRVLLQQPVRDREAAPEARDTVEANSPLLVVFRTGGRNVPQCKTVRGGAIKYVDRLCGSARQFW
jgi:hypothetical protein